MTCGPTYTGGKRKNHRKHFFKGGNAFMPADINAGNEIGGYAATQSSPLSNTGTVPNLALIQSGGKTKRKHFRGGLVPLSPSELDAHALVAPTSQSGGKTKRKHFRGGLVPLTPSVLGEQQPPHMSGGKQKGGYFTELMQSAIVPFGLAGLNYYAHQRTGKKPYLGRSRISKQLRSRRNRR